MRKRPQSLILILLSLLVGCAQPQGIVRSGKQFKPTVGHELVREGMGIDYVSTCQDHCRNRHSKR